MDLLQLLILLVIAGICGALAELILGRRLGSGSLIITVILGVIGAYFGSWLSFSLGLPGYAIEVGTMRMDLAWSLAGTLLVLALLSVVREGRFGLPGGRLRR
ncbi:MAG TPA: GlsB/YeaQ/YmgE family stress response membrane protein [Roseiflexaceae bacterium]|nr:GlsB/YeaQ/YmgE family stress response membrane protein [Roseiflexaceae bacterium]